jgi:hypothetical protein
MDLKDVYIGALRRFKRRNLAVLPRVQLQYGRNERWFVREFALAVNQHLGGGTTPRTLRSFASCEYGYADLSIWDNDGDHLAARIEAKAIYSDATVTPEAAVRRAREQLKVKNRRLGEAGLKAGLFFTIFTQEGAFEAAHLRDFEEEARDAIRGAFTSDQDIRLTEMCPPSAIVFGHEQWHTSSRIAWGTLRSAR